jgi:hypothetical protein
VVGHANTLGKLITWNLIPYTMFTPEHKVCFNEINEQNNYVKMILISVKTIMDSQAKKDIVHRP